MSISINQTPASASLAQSPMIFSVLESSADILLSSSMQYVAELTYWTGSILVSGSSDYTLTKFPNQENYGIFDVSKIINSTLTEKVAENPSNAVYFKCEFYPQFIASGSTAFTTGSHSVSDVFSAIDGYGIFGESISSSLQDKSDFFPILTDGPVTQSFFSNGYGRMGCWINGINDVYATEIAYSGSSGETQTFGPFVTSGDTSALIGTFPIGELESDWPFTSEHESFTVQAKTTGGAFVGSQLLFVNKCQQKYPNVRVKWKNRFGQFDYFDFDMVSRQGFSTTKRTYQPQIGSWESSTLGYNSYDSSVENYVSDSSQTLQVNTDWVSEDYNDIFKQLLVSDEIYWMWSGDDIKPLTITTSNIQFKTDVVDKLIRYTFDFNLGQNYKLIL